MKNDVMKFRSAGFVLTMVLILIGSCKLTGPSGLLAKRSPHEQYEQKLKDLGIQETAMGSRWMAEAGRSLENPLQISVPYKEAGYFAADRPRATALTFRAERGQKITVNLQKRPSENFTIYVDLWEVKSNDTRRLLAYADTAAAPFDYDIDDEGTYLLRLQPELLAAGEYTLNIQTGPQLAFPVDGGRIGSFWGADRDGGARRHEGVDIFAVRGTPALAAADGTVSRVGENTLGGKVIFMRPSGKSYSLYYAHLDEQLVTGGERVKAGDTIGLVGNTGNARTTSPHLHFGIYTFGGAINPIHFIRKAGEVPEIAADASQLGKMMRSRSARVNFRAGPANSFAVLSVLPERTLVRVQGATLNWYKVVLPSGLEGFIYASSLSPADGRFQTLKLDQDLVLLDKPQAEAARKRILPAGSRLDVLGVFDTYFYVRGKDYSGWIQPS